jgi:D-arabinose 1-dehydrogenase-like Zn-dependent alcohol dehydrogenase
VYLEGGFGNLILLIKLYRGNVRYPAVVGHEITGTATRVGANVKHIKVGDRIGVGAQSGACLECRNCKRGDENICQGPRTSTYNSLYANGDKSFGGYADKWR